MLIIPDVHGRSFWKNAVKGREDEEMIFLGDYVDPYSSLEGIYPWEGYVSLKEIVEFKKEHESNVTLLLGNHDLSYITNYVYECRHDYENHDEIKCLIKDNISLFKIAHKKIIKGKRYVFSHAGILPRWVTNIKAIFESIPKGFDVDVLNELFFSEELYEALGDVSPYRGGRETAGSPVWADAAEHRDAIKYIEDDIQTEVFQIFGHTQQMSGQPVITPYYACLDCRRAFELDENGKIK